MTVNDLFDNPETKPVPILFAALERIKQCFSYSITYTNAIVCHRDDSFFTPEDHSDVQITGVWKRINSIQSRFVRTWNISPRLTDAITLSSDLVCTLILLLEIFTRWR
jgi:hypothetical protein